MGKGAPQRGVCVSAEDHQAGRSSKVQGFTRDVRESSGRITASAREQQAMLLPQSVAKVKGGNALMHLGLRGQARHGHALQASKAPRQTCMQIPR